MENMLRTIYRTYCKHEGVYNSLQNDSDAEELKKLLQVVNAVRVIVYAVKDIFKSKDSQVVSEPFEGTLNKKTLFSIHQTSFCDPMESLSPQANEGFFVRYSVNRKAFRVFNRRTRIVQETLHINFLENKPNVTGSGPKWLFDIDTLTQSMNYQPVVAGNQPNHKAGIKENLDTDDDDAFDVKENENKIYVSPSIRDKLMKHDEKDKREAKGQSPVKLSIGVRGLNDEFKEFYVNSTNRVNAANATVTTVGPNLTNNTNRFNVADMPALEDIVYSDYEEDVGVEADLSILETTISVSPIPTTRGHKDHPEEGIDYHEVFSPVARIKAIRLFLAYASFMGVMVYQMDVKSNFLYGTIVEEVYVCQPLGFEDLDYPDKVYRVVKALYGFHQAPKAWHCFTAISYKLMLFGLTKDAAVKLMLLGHKLWFLLKVNDVVKLCALIDGKRVVVTEDVIRHDLHLDDVDGMDCLPNEEIFTELIRRKFNFSKYIINNMVRNVDSPSKFLMYPQFLQVIINAQVDDLSSQTNQYTSPALTQKVFGNMRRVDKGFFLGVETPLFATMLVQPQPTVVEEEDEVKVPSAPTPSSL
uniref:Putative ribonuclease H-like domain-containing protein n=1 Tax=Tanacetum cinerariifolium TaxID=118510 RepID=A0A699GKF5_TANCI|nr:putative ribonuclease H-like domain-containing protein [Tanacetum cinerariifolium]